MSSAPALRAFLGRIAAACAIVLAFVAGAALLVVASDVFLLVFAGILMAIMLRGLAARLARATGMPAGASLLAVAAVLLGVLVGGVLASGPRIAAQADMLAQQLPEAAAALEARVVEVPLLQRLLDHLPPTSELVVSRGDVLGRITGFFSTTFGAIANLLIVVAVGAYLAADPRLYVDGTARLFPRRMRPRVCALMHRLGTALGWWLASKAVSMAVIGVLTGIGLALLGIPMPVTLALITALLTFIPNIGPILSVIPAALLALVQGPTVALYVLLLYAGVQFVETYLVTPKVQQEMVSLPPAVTLVAQLLAGVLAGGLGLVLAAPLAAGAMVLVDALAPGDGGDEHAAGP